MKSVSTILLPLKLNFRPAGCITVGDAIEINSLGVLNGQISVVSSNCVFSAEYNYNKKNGERLRRRLLNGQVNGKVFALFSKHFIVELLVEESSSFSSY